MMQMPIQYIKNLLSNNLILKVTALLVGCAIWLHLNQQRIIALTLRVPVCLYNEPENLKIEAPQEISVTLCGKWSHFVHLKPNNLAVHLDCQSLIKESNNIIVNDQNLFLPPHIKLLEWSPAPLKIIVMNKPELNECIS